MADFLRNKIECVMSEQVKYVTVKQFAEFMGVAIPTVYSWIETNRIPKENIKKVVDRIVIKKERV